MQAIIPTATTMTMIGLGHGQGGMERLVKAHFLTRPQYRI